MVRYFVIFLLLVVVLFAVELLPIGQTGFVLPFTARLARTSAEVMQLVDDQVQVQGKIIWYQTTGFAISIEAGCNGVEAGIILLAAMLAFPATWRQKLIGILIGLVSVEFLNIVRIVTLFYLGQWDKQMFEWVHLYIWQALIMLDVLLIFLFWLRWCSTSGIAQKT